jgi:hypothetical protein
MMQMNFLIWTSTPRRDRLIVSTWPCNLPHGHDQAVPAEYPDELVKQHHRVR